MRKSFKDLKKTSKNEMGITLIALVITIIVLLILAGTSIAMLSGDSSILSKAGEAKTQTQEKSKEELIQLEVIGSIGEDGKINATILKTNLAKLGATTSEESNLPLIVTLGEQRFIVDTNGVVTKVGDIPTSSFGYNETENCFIGQKSIGKITEGVEDNTQKANWDSSKNGYKFEVGHFVYAPNYSYSVYNSTNGSWDVTTGDVYFCWDADDGEINTPNQRLLIQGEWDIFDASSGEWLGIQPPT